MESEANQMQTGRTAMLNTILPTLAIIYEAFVPFGKLSDSSFLV